MIWLSFANEEMGALGAAVMDTDNREDAMRMAREQDIIPAGSDDIIGLPISRADIGDMPINEFVDAADVVDHFGVARRMIMSRDRKSGALIDLRYA